VGGNNKSKVQNTYTCITHLELIDKTLEEKTPTPKTRQTMKQFKKDTQHIRIFHLHLMPLMHQQSLHLNKA
jgi:CRISPR/Cas system endoribonuclease Cas6 (RAMP superfamily)